MLAVALALLPALVLLGWIFYAGER